jgi:hypothetical protein
MEDSIKLSGMQMAFLMSRFDTKDPDKAVELFVEELVSKGLDPMQLKEYVSRIMARENN